MLCKRGLCRHAVSVCPSVCVSVAFVNSVKTNKHIFKILSPLGSQAILVFFSNQTPWQYSDGNPPPPTGASNAGGVDKNHGSEFISGSTASCQRCDRSGVSTAPPDHGPASNYNNKRQYSTLCTIEANY